MQQSNLSCKSPALRVVDTHTTLAAAHLWPPLHVFPFLSLFFHFFQLSKRTVLHPTDTKGTAADHVRHRHRSVVKLGSR